MKNLILFIAVISLGVSFLSCKKVRTLDEISSKSIPDDTSKIDLDLSKMNYNMLTSTTFDIMISPENYVNKRIKTSGNFYTSIYENQRYYSVLIWDATGCCPAGFDFIPPLNMNFPEDFPEEGEGITVTGVLKYLDFDGQEGIAFVAEEIIKENL